MNDVQQRAAAKHFAEYWQGKGYEKGESQKFWLSLLTDVFGVEHAAEYICASFDYDPEKIGKHMLEVMARQQSDQTRL